jgi:ketosteroid isomerase-like protein
MVMGALKLALLSLFVVSATPVDEQPIGLQINSPIDKEMSPTENHEYVVTARANQRIHVVVEQKGIDVVVSVVGPNGKKLLEKDSPNGPNGPEDVVIPALTAGPYRVQIAPFQSPAAAAGRYTITLTELRPLSATELATAHNELELTALESQWEEAVDANDTVTLAKIMRDDGVVLAQVAALTLAKQPHLAEFDQRRQQLEKLTGVREEHTRSEHVLRVFGNTAVSTGRAVKATTVQGWKPSRISGQFIHVWQKDKTGWKLIVDHFYPYGRLPRAKAVSPSVDPKVLSAYAGTYEIENGSRLTVRAAGGKLDGDFSGPVRKDTTSFEPVSATTFVLFDGQLEATFVRSPQGDVDEVILLSDGPALRGVRVK